jgi:hypothetical protein
MITELPDLLRAIQRELVNSWGGDAASVLVNRVEIEIPVELCSPSPEGAVVGIALPGAARREMLGKMRIVLVAVDD